MASEKQIQANRQNALGSTGPKSPDGKARAARNSLKHGLLSRDVLVPGEDRKELRAFCEAMLAALEPEGELESFLADRVVAAAWRLRRANRLERDVVEKELLDGMRSRAQSPSLYKDSFRLTAERVGASTVCHSDTYGKISRYEVHIERMLYRALHELQRLQAARKGGQAPLPLAVDVDVTGLPSEEVPVPERRSLQREVAMHEAAEVMAPVGGSSPKEGTMTPPEANAFCETKPFRPSVMSPAEG